MISREAASAAKAQAVARLAGHHASVGLQVEQEAGYTVRVNVAEEQDVQVVRELLGESVDGVPVRLRVIGRTRPR